MRRFALLCFLGCLPLLAFAAKAPPEKQLDIFFETLRENGSDPAIRFLTKDTLLGSHKAQQMSALRIQFDGAFAIYGKPSRFEIARTDNIGKSLIRHRVISFHEDGMPLFWNFTFFKRGDQWEVLSFSFIDHVEKMFPLE